MPQGNNLEILKRPTTSKEVESVTEHILTKKSPGPSGFTAEFYEPFKVELTSILLKLFKNN